ncbi:pterin-binding family [Chlorella sorokiniana]|uniref:Pterin-binding family n=1 Tax=Chlorella sorokiniana TaxID=3076 RepID=A0A2P6TJ42_CHLSO|nr:pterin-binding family [Chlorella sorokiniana]|eukprot:PRW39253.1 pterin-binding family [Chlorella sorokiniana]
MQSIALQAAQRPQAQARLTSGAPRQPRRLPVQQQLLWQHRSRPSCSAAGAAAPEQAAAAAEVPRWDAALDNELSKRPLDLDAAGYFIIKLDREAGELVADFYTNFINEQGLACDPATGEVISCKPGQVRLPTRTWRGRTAKALSVEILEKDYGFQPCTHLEHANYLGRELQRAEFALISGQQYASLAPHAAAGGDGVLATHIARVRALACPPADAASWVHCEELQDELKAALAGWRSWPEDACCDESVRALSLLLAAVDAAPVWLEVFFPTQDRDEWDTRLLGPAVLPAGGRKRRLNHELHAEMWGGEYVRGPGNNDSARVQPDDLLKWIGAAYWESFPAKVERGSELEYEMRCQSYVLFCRMGIALNQPHNAAALEARLHQLRSPLTVEALRHVIHQQKCFLATQMFKHPQERQHQALQMVATTSVWEYMLRLRPTSLRTLAICASTFMDLNMPDAALRLALMGLRLAVAHTGRQGEEQPGQPGEQQGEQPGAPGQHEEQQGQEQPGQQCQGLDEPYHHALLHLVAAHAIVTGGGGGRSFPVAELQPHLKGSRAAKAACRAWLPTALRAALQGAQLALPLTEQEVAAAVQARRTTLPVQLPQPPLGVLLAQGFAPPPPRHRAGGQGGHGSGACDCPVCRSSASTRCAGCNNVGCGLARFCAWMLPNLATARASVASNSPHFPICIRRAALAGGAQAGVR